MVSRGLQSKRFTLFCLKCARLRKEFKKRLNDLEPTDRVVLIACTSKQHEAGAKEMKDMKEFFDKALYFPFPNYSTRKLVFKTMVERAGGILKENFPLSTLAYITEGYTAGSFKRAIDKVLTERRRAQVSSPHCDFLNLIVGHETLSLIRVRRTSIIDKHSI